MIAFCDHSLPQLLFVTLTHGILSNVQVEALLVAAGAHDSVAGTLPGKSFVPPPPLNSLAPSDSMPSTSDARDIGEHLRRVCANGDQAGLEGLLSTGQLTPSVLDSRYATARACMLMSEHDTHHATNARVLVLSAIIGRGPISKVYQPLRNKGKALT